MGDTGRVYALDRQPAAARMVEGRAAGQGARNVEVVISDCATGLPDASVDVALLYDTIHAIEDRRGVLAEIGRVLRPQGVLSVWVEHGDPDGVSPLVTENSPFVLKDRHEDVLNFAK